MTKLEQVKAMKVYEYNPACWLCRYQAGKERAGLGYGDLCEDHSRAIAVLYLQSPDPDQGARRTGICSILDDMNNDYALERKGAYERDVPTLGEYADRILSLFAGSRPEPRPLPESSVAPLQSSQLCLNCGEPLGTECACFRNKCIKCGKPVGNVTFTYCDECFPKKAAPSGDLVERMAKELYAWTGGLRLTPTMQECHDLASRLIEITGEGASGLHVCRMLVAYQANFAKLAYEPGRMPGNDHWSGEAMKIVEAAKAALRSPPPETGLSDAMDAARYGAGKSDTTRPGKES